MYSFTKQYQSWPHHIQNEFRSMVVHEEELCSYGTFFNWLSKGVAPGSKAIIRLDELVNQYQTRSDVYLAKIAKRKQIALNSQV